MVYERRRGVDILMIEGVICLILMILGTAYILIKEWTKLVQAITESFMETKKLLKEFRGLVVEVRKLKNLFKKK